MRNRHVRAYRALLRVYPRRFRVEYTDEMCRVFAQQIHYARVTEGWTGVLRVWVRSLIDLVTPASSEHLDNEVLVVSPAGADSWQTHLDSNPPDRRWVLIGLGPMWALLALFLVARLEHRIVSDAAQVLRTACWVRDGEFGPRLGFGWARRAGKSQTAQAAAAHPDRPVRDLDRRGLKLGS